MCVPMSYIRTDLQQHMRNFVPNSKHIQHLHRFCEKAFVLGKWFQFHNKAGVSSFGNIERKDRISEGELPHCLAYLAYDMMILSVNLCLRVLYAV